MRALISGGTGFVGSFLASLLADQGVEVSVLSKKRHNEQVELDSRVRCQEGDIRSKPTVDQAVQETHPDEIYHLAAISSIPYSWKHPKLTFEVNVLGSANIFQASISLLRPARVLNVSTGQVYGSRGEGSAIFDENAPVRPGTPYATSKAMVELLAHQFVESNGAWIVTARSFNHVGPGQSTEFVLSNFARQFALIEAGQSPPLLRVGNLDVERDFTDVRDVVRAYQLLLKKGKPGSAYNVCSGHPHRIASAVSILQAITSIRVDVKVDSDKLRSTDLRSVCGDPSKLKAETGWEPTISFEDSLRDLLDYWRQRVLPQPRTRPGRPETRRL